MPASNYYCYSCERNVPLRDGDLICGMCGGEFIEELAQPEVRAPSIFRRNPINIVFDNMLGAGTSRSPAIRMIQTHGMSNDDSLIRVFLNELVANLSSQGGRVEVQFSPDPSLYSIGPLHGPMADYVWGDAGLDQIVTQLLNQFEGSSINPVDPNSVGNLPMISAQQKHIDAETQCPTCMENFVLDEPVAVLDCQHIFHRNCILPWFERRDTCPICRKPVDPSNWPSKDHPLDDLD